MTVNNKSALLQDTDNIGPASDNYILIQYDS